MLKTPLKILADENMPALSACFSHYGSVKTQAGRDMRPADVQEVDVLLVRSITQVNASLLKGSRVRFVGSATIGTDHIDLEYLKQHNITFANAPGSNAQSVVEYVLTAVAHWCQSRNKDVQNLTIGIIGKGQIGGRLARFLTGLNVTVKCHDPPLENQGCEGVWHTLEEVLTCDVITCHVPYTLQGLHPTHHLISDDELQQIKAGALFINTSRGSVVDNNALKSWINRGGFDVVLDVWEGEPDIDLQLMDQVLLATPHVAGYAQEAKIRGTFMLYQALSHWLEQSETVTFEQLLPSAPPGVVFQNSHQWITEIERHHNIKSTDQTMRHALTQRTHSFDQLRKNHTQRREFLLSL